MDESTSPTPIKAEVHVDFYTALKAAVDGAHITKAEWQNKEIYGYIQEEILKLFKDDGKTYNWILSAADILGTDWIVL